MLALLAEPLTRRLLALSFIFSSSSSSTTLVAPLLVVHGSAAFARSFGAAFVATTTTTTTTTTSYRYFDQLRRPTRRRHRRRKHAPSSPPMTRHSFSFSRTDDDDDDYDDCVPDAAANLSSYPADYDYESYRRAASSFWSDRFNATSSSSSSSSSTNNQVTPATIGRLVDVVSRRSYGRGDDPLVDLERLDGSLRRLQDALRRETLFKLGQPRRNGTTAEMAVAAAACDDAALRLAARCPFLLREVTTDEGWRAVQDRIKAIRALLPGLADDKGGGRGGGGGWWKEERNDVVLDLRYLDLVSRRIPPAMLRRSADLSAGSDFDRKIDVLAKAFFPEAKEEAETNEEDENIFAVGREGREEAIVASSDVGGKTTEDNLSSSSWERRRAASVRIAASLLSISLSTLQSRCAAFPRVIGLGKAGTIGDGGDFGRVDRDQRDAAAAEVLRRYPRLLASKSDVVEKRRMALERIFRDGVAATLIRKRPRLLGIDVEARIPSVLSALQRYLPSDIDPKDFVLRHPHILLTPASKGDSANRVLSRRIERSASILFGDGGALDYETLITSQTSDLSGGLVRESVERKENRKLPEDDAASVLLRYPQTLAKADAKGNATLTLLESKISQLASVLGIGKSSAKNMLRKAPRLAGMDIKGGTIEKRCTDMAELLKCSHSQFASIAKQHPGLLLYRVETLKSKLMQLDRLLEAIAPSNGERSGEAQHVLDASLTDNVSRDGVQNTLICFDIAPSTLIIARRAPQLMALDISGLVTERALSLRKLLLGDFEIGTTNRIWSESFAKMLKRCPQLLLHDVDCNIAPKVEELNRLLPLFKFQVSSDRSNAWDEVRSQEVGKRLAIREPRLLLYNFAGTLLPKAEIFRARTLDPMLFDAVLARYPSLLTYGFGSAARLDYYAYRYQGIKPDAHQMRTLVTLSKDTVKDWGDNDRTVSHSSVPSVLSGYINNSGRPRIGESYSAVWRRKRPQQVKVQKRKRLLREMTLDELRGLFRRRGGKPRKMRKDAIIRSLQESGLKYDPDFHPAMGDATQEGTRVDEACKLLSYRQWILLRLCDPWFDRGVKSEHQLPSVLRDHIKCTAGSIGIASLEKLYGTALHGSQKARGNELKFTISGGKAKFKFVAS